MMFSKMIYNRPNLAEFEKQGPQFLPYATAIDEFQHIVYAARNYDGQPYLEKGTFWQMWV